MNPQGFVMNELLLNSNRLNQLLSTLDLSSLFLLILLDPSGKDTSVADSAELQAQIEKLKKELEDSKVQIKDLQNQLKAAKDSMPDVATTLQTPRAIADDSVCRSN